MFGLLPEEEHVVVALIAGRLKAAADVTDVAQEEQEEVAIATAARL